MGIQSKLISKITEVALERRLNQNVKWIVCGLLLLVFAIYGWFLPNPFLMDDEIQVTLNTHIQSLHNFWTYFKSSTMYSGGRETMFGVYFKPFMSLYYAVIWHFFGAVSWAYRLPLLLAHGLSAVFLFFLIRRRLRPDLTAALIAVVTAVLFVVHPVNSEVVLYIADVQDTFYLFFGLLSLVCVEFLSHRTGMWIGLVATLISALFFKETGGIFLVLTPAYAWFYHRKKYVASLSAAFVVGLVYAGLRWNAGLIHTHNAELMFHKATALDRLKMLPLILWHYVELLVFPLRLSITRDFLMTDYPVDRFWLPLAFVIALLITIMIAIRKNPQFLKIKGVQWSVLLFILWFILHGQQLVPLDGIYADRWLYPLTPILALAVALLLVKSKWEPGVKAAVMLTLVALSVGRDVVRGLQWKTPIELYKYEVELNPDHALMASNVGHELMKAQRPQEALPWFERAIKANPYWSVSTINAGAAHEALGDQKKAEAYYRKAISMAHYPFAYENLLKLLYNQKRHDEAKALLRGEALPRYPQNALFLKVEDYYQRVEAAQKSQPAKKRK